MEKIKVKLMGEGHSAGRGVGFYRKFLAAALKESAAVQLVENNPDVIHYPFFDLFYPTLPLPKSKPTVVTIHDLTPLVLTQYYPAGLRAHFNLRRQRHSLSSAAAIITDSLNSRADLIRLFNLPENKIHVIPLAADPVYAIPTATKELERVSRAYKLPPQFVLYVGGINANKNILRLAEVCVTLKLKLVLVGSEFTKEPLETFSFKKILGLQRVHPELREYHRLREFVAKHPVAIQVLGYVSSTDLTAIYRLASVYCQPSLYEGFGLTLLEAMSAGCLVVSSNTGSLPEIYPAGTITFDPRDTSSIGAALTQALNLAADKREHLLSLQREKAKKYSWQKTAALTTKVYQAVKISQ